MQCLKHVETIKVENTRNKLTKKKATKETVKYTIPNYKKHVHSVTSEYGCVTWLPQDDIAHDSGSHNLYMCEDGLNVGVKTEESRFIESHKVPSCSRWLRN